MMQPYTANGGRVRWSETALREAARCRLRLLGRIWAITLAIMRDQDDPERARVVRQDVVAGFRKYPVRNKFSFDADALKRKLEATESAGHAVTTAEALDLWKTLKNINLE